jgi:hypothetical protein
MLNAEGVRNSFSAARVKLPHSAMVTKVRNTSLSRSGNAARFSFFVDCVSITSPFKLPLLAHGKKVERVIGHEREDILWASQLPLTVDAIEALKARKEAFTSS